MPVTRTEVLRLYKNLLLYSRSLTLTDPAFFRRKISSEFRRNKGLANLDDITFAYQARRYYNAVLSSKMILRSISNLRAELPPQILVAFKHTIDYTRVPKINEADLAEQFVRGSGPGGSAVNKNSNCVVLTHVPTGTVVKCHLSRSQDENRKLARQMLVDKLDDALNGAESVLAQKKRIEEQKYRRTESKKKKMAKIKSEWRKREGLE